MHAYRIEFKPNEGPPPGNAFMVLPYPNRKSGDRFQVAKDIAAGMCVLYFDCDITVRGPLELSDGMRFEDIELYAWHELEVYHWDGE